MEIQEYTDWSLEIHKRTAVQRIPINGTIEVTQRCNNNCVHCYNNLALGDKGARRQELSFTEHCRILDEITEAGCLWLLFTGGEIFSRKDFLDIYTYAKNKGLVITLFTNGTLITPEIADYLMKWRPFAIEITLYGRTRETYEQVTRVPGSFDRCMRGIHLLMERKLPLMLKSMAISLNTHEIWDMKRFVEDDLGLDFKFDTEINPRCDCSQSPLEVRPSPAEVVELDLQDPSRVTEWKRFTDAFRNRKKSDRIWQCGGGLCTFAIDPYGSLHMCVLSQDGSYDLSRGHFQEGWEQALYQVRQKRITRQTKCVTCGIRSMCGMCPANAELECRDAEIPVDFLCHVAHLRAYSFDIPFGPHGDCEYCEGGSRYQEIMQEVKKLKRV